MTLGILQCCTSEEYLHSRTTSPNNRTLLRFETLPHVDWGLNKGDILDSIPSNAREALKKLSQPLCLLPITVNNGSSYLWIGISNITNWPGIEWQTMSPIHRQKDIYCDNKNVVWISYLLYSTLKKEQLCICYHFVRNCCAKEAARITRKHMDEKSTIIGTKVLDAVEWKKIASQLSHWKQFFYKD